MKVEVKDGECILRWQCQNGLMCKKKGKDDMIECDEFTHVYV